LSIRHVNLALKSIDTHQKPLQATIRVSTCMRQVAVFMLTNSESDAEIGTSKIFTMEVQQLSRHHHHQQQQQQQQQQQSVSCSCQPKYPWMPADCSPDASISTSPAALEANASLPELSSRRHTPFVTGVFITPMSAADTAEAGSRCAFAAEGTALAVGVLASEWEVRLLRCSAAVAEFTDRRCT
jgi:hypothetical protein